jgi:hypothetical protein
MEITDGQRIDGTELRNGVGESRDVILLLRPLRMIHISVLEFLVCRHFWRIYLRDMRGRDVPKY